MHFECHHARGAVHKEPHDLAAEYAKTAEECVEIAERSKRPEDKARWLRIAQRSMQLARENDLLAKVKADRAAKEAERATTTGKPAG